MIMPRIPAPSTRLLSTPWGMNTTCSMWVARRQWSRTWLACRDTVWCCGSQVTQFGDLAGPNGQHETALAGYLEAGGKLFLDSQDYLYDFGLTPFGQNYLGIGSFSSDVGDATSIVGVAGDPIGDGLGPYALTYPSGFSDYGDIVNAATGASTAFKANNNVNKLDIDKEGDNWNTVFFGTSWVSVYNNNSSNGELVLQRMLDWFGGCQVDYGILEGHVVDADTSAPLEGVLVTVTPGIAGIQSITDPTGYYSMTLQSGTYTATASLDGYVSQSQITTIIAGETTTVDFSLEEGCDPSILK